MQLVLLFILFILFTSLLSNIQIYREQYTSHNQNQNSEKYCRYYDKCIKKPDNWMNCGTQMLYNDIEPIYNTLEDCKNNLNPYSKLSKEQCIQHNNAGWCTDYLGNGVCLPGTAEGPTNFRIWDTCYVGQWTPMGQKTNNTWTHIKNL